MSAIRREPPRWAEVLLARLVPATARETIVGDLREEFVETIVPQKGIARARVWYLRQAVSFIPISAKENAPMGKLLVLVSAFMLICAGWLGLMELLLHHPGYPQRIGVAAIIAIVCASTILVRLLHAGFRNERWLWLGAALLIGIGTQAFLRNARAAHFEGFVFLISLLLIVQGALMLATLGRSGVNEDPHSGRLRPAAKPQ